jgi:hypothetical protein
MDNVVIDSYRLFDAYELVDAYGLVFIAYRLYSSYSVNF